MIYGSTNTSVHPFLKTTQSFWGKTSNSFPDQGQGGSNILLEGQKEQIQPLEEVGFHKVLAHPCSSLHNATNQPKQIWFQLAKMTLLPQKVIKFGILSPIREFSCAWPVERIIKNSKLPPDQGSVMKNMSYLICALIKCILLHEEISIFINRNKTPFEQVLICNRISINPPLFP